MALDISAGAYRADIMCICRQSQAIVCGPCKATVPAHYLAEENAPTWAVDRLIFSMPWLTLLTHTQTRTHTHTRLNHSISPGLSLQHTQTHRGCREYLEERTFIHMLCQQLTLTLYINGSCDSFGTRWILRTWQTFMDISRFIPLRSVVSMRVHCSFTSNRALQIGLINSLYRYHDMPFILTCKCVHSGTIYGRSKIKLTHTYST